MVFRFRFQGQVSVAGGMLAGLLLLGLVRSPAAQEEAGEKASPSRPATSVPETPDGIEKWLEDLAAKAPPKLTRKEWTEKFLARWKAVPGGQEPASDSEIVRLITTYTWHAVPQALAWLEGPGPDAKPGAPAAEQLLPCVRLIARVMARKRKAPGLQAILDRTVNWTDEDRDVFKKSQELGAEAWELYKKHEWAASEKRFLEAAKRCRACGCLDCLADTLWFAALSQLYDGRYRRAASHLKEVLALRTQVGNESAMGESLSALGGVFYKLGRLDVACRHCRRSLAIQMRTGNEDRIATPLRNLGNIALDLSRYEEARSYYRISLAVSEKKRDDEGKAMSLDSLGLVSGAVGDLEKALDYHRAALELFTKTGGKVRIATSLQNQANVLHLMGRYEEAFDRTHQALRLAEDTHNLARIAASLTELGLLSNRLGRSEDAVRYHLRALELVKVSGNRVYIAASFNNLGEAYFGLGRYKKAIEYQLRALELDREIGNKSDIAHSETNLGNAHYKLGHHQQALKHYRRTLDLLASGGNERVKAAARTGLGNVLHAMGRYEEALGQYRRALALEERNGDRAKTADPLSNLGMVSRSLGHAEDALDYCQRAIAIFNDIGDKTSVAMPLNTLACTLLGLGRIREAREQFTRALDRVRGARERLVTDRDRIGFMGMWQGWLVRTVEAALMEKPPDIVADPTLALRAVETLRGMATADQMQAALLGAEPSRLSPLAAKARALSNEIDALAKRVRATGGRRGTLKARRRQGALRKRLEKRQRDLERQRRDTVERLERESPEYAQIERPRPISLDALKKELPADTAYLTFALGEKRSILLLVDRNGLRDWTLPGRRIIEDAVAAHLKQMGNRAADPTAMLRTGHHLYSLLLEPAEVALSRYETLLVAPEGVLNGLPLGTLVTRETSDLRTAPYLVKAHAVVYANSATVWRIDCERAAKRAAEYVAEKRPRPARALVLADPVGPAESGWEKAGAPMSILIEHERSGFGRLPGTRREAFGVLEGFSGEAPAGDWRVEINGGTTSADALARALAAARGASDDVRDLTLTTPEVDLRLGSAASRKALLSTPLSPYRFIHLACHGLVSEHAPGLSALVLSPAENDSGVLKLVDVMNLRLEAQVVTLSGCRTAGGESTAAEGFQGLVRAFLFAGADNVIASAWRVPDRETATLLPGVYASMVKEKRSPIEALRQAKLGYLRSVPKSAPETAHPYYWGAWMLWGSGK